MSGEKSDPETTNAGRRRRLSAEEEHLWSSVARTVKPLRLSRKTAPAISLKTAVPADARAHKKKRPSEPVAATHPRRAPAAIPVSLARREKQQLARGRTTIDARIDLHGMTQAQAHGALLRFLHRSQGRGAKFVLVITGKGLPTAPQGERGVLRRQVPLWFALPEFRACVLGFDVAHTEHGGEGALYVRLRRTQGSSI
jgi:DNA-nicking Smr family endonuclease